MCSVIHHPALEIEGARQILELQPLQITLRTLQPIVATEPLHLDGLLAKAVVMEALQGDVLPQTTDAYYIPLPLGVERIIDGLPLWQSTDFVPVEAKSDHTHYHQRGDCNPYDKAAAMLLEGRRQEAEGKKKELLSKTGEAGNKRKNKPSASCLSTPASRKQPPTTEGQYMSYRVPIKRTIASHWKATCVGDRRFIEQYLSLLQYVGKKHSQGYGRVLSWEVKPIDEFVLRDRPIPLAGSNHELRNLTMMGWTPPYWHRALWRMCYFA